MPSFISQGMITNKLSFTRLAKIILLMIVFVTILFDISPRT
jgi:hypothetical protein